jgi:hypothetical protein
VLTFFHIFQFSPGDKKIMSERTSILSTSQKFLTNNPDFPQYTYQGKYHLGIQLPDRKLSPDELETFVESVFGKSEVKQIVAQVALLAVGKIQTEIKNQATAAVTRAPQVSSTIGKKWKAAIESDDVELASRMFEQFESNADLFELTELQVENLRKELESIGG